MEDVAVWIFWAIAIGGGLVSSIMKAQKQKETAQRSRPAEPQRPQGGRDIRNPRDSRDPRDSVGEGSAPRYYSMEDDYGVGPEHGFEDEVASFERLATERTRRKTYVAAARSEATKSATAFGASAFPSADLEVDPAADPNDDAQTSAREILGGEFDLRRAVIEAEILNPKFGQY